LFYDIRAGAVRLPLYLMSHPRSVADIETLVQHDLACQRLMTAPGIGPIISSAMVAAQNSLSASEHTLKWLFLHPAAASVYGAVADAVQELLARMSVSRSVRRKL
jgi:transposase